MRTLGLKAAGGADVREIADAAVATWGAVDGALAPVIGSRGSAALYRRSVHLVRADFAWLVSAYEASDGPGRFDAFRAALLQQTPVQAAAAHDATLQTFHDLLADLIGRSLTDRLLQAVWESPSGGNTAKDAL